VDVARDVIHDMKVQASGDIFVGGTVEGGSLDAKGNISVKGGIIASSWVHADGNISARFVQASSLEAGAVIVLDDAALDAKLVSHQPNLDRYQEPAAWATDWWAYPGEDAFASAAFGLGKVGHHKN